jgi:hypothetical protein
MLGTDERIAKATRCTEHFYRAPRGCRIFMMGCWESQRKEGQQVKTQALERARASEWLGSRVSRERWRICSRSLGNRCSCCGRVAEDRARDNREWKATKSNTVRREDLGSARSLDDFFDSLSQFDQ